jgi:hypothetical protein
MMVSYQRATIFEQLVPVAFTRVTRTGNISCLSSVNDTVFPDPAITTEIVPCDPMYSALVVSVRFTVSDGVTATASLKGLVNPSA